MDLSIPEVADFIGARVVGDVSSNRIHSISTDTRALSRGDCFVALKGETHDAHVFVGDAVSSGAACLVVEREFPELPQVAQLVVSDTLFALGEIARMWRSRLAHIPVAVLTGSGGKTTTKEMAAAAVRGTKRVLATQGNLNNLFGLPRMLFGLTAEHEAAILELGMNVPGELRRLIEISSPQSVALTNIANAHIGMFGSQEALYQAKADSLRYSSDGAVLVLNSDDPLSRRAREEFARGREVISFGYGAEADVTARNVERVSPYGYRFRLSFAEKGRETSGADVELRIFGKHNIANAMAAAAIARFFGVPVDQIALRLSHFSPMGNRSEVEQIRGWYLIKDYYNASPAAVEQALSSLEDFTISGRRFAVLADMLELGDMEETFHTRVGEIAAVANLARLYTIGDRARAICDAARCCGAQAEHMSGPEEVARRLQGELQPGDLLLIKGSRLMKLERIYDLLKS